MIHGSVLTECVRFQEVNEEIAATALQAVFDRHSKGRKRPTGPGPNEWDVTANAKLVRSHTTALSPAIFGSILRDGL